MEIIKKAHKESFNEEDKIFFMINPKDNSPKLFMGSEGNLKALDGYTVYYEKNEEMQNYMIEWNGGGKKKEAVLLDGTVKEIRKILEEKKEKKRRNAAGMAYICVMGVALLFIVCCVSILNQYGTSPAVQETLNTLSSQQVTSPPTSQTDIQASETKEEEPTGQTTEVVQKAEPIEENDVAQGSEEEETYYVVKEGDTLVSISRKYYGTMKGVERIMEANGIKNEKKLKIGQELVIPK